MIALPKQSKNAEYTKNAFSGCSILEGRCFGGDLLAFLSQRFDKLPGHKICYNAASTGVTVEDLPPALTDATCVDAFGMTPLHILASSAKPRHDLFQFLADRFQSHVLSQRDNENFRPIDYLCQNESPNAARLIQMILERTMLSRMKHWGLPRWESDLGNKIESLSSCSASIASSKAVSKPRFLTKIERELARYERLEVLSVLELSIWKIARMYNKASLSSSVGRYSCRVRCGAETIIPNVQEFL